MQRFLLFFVFVFSMACYAVLRFHLAETQSTEVCTKTNATTNQFPKIVWLASYPNSGTSYTMTMVQRATNLATATQYGAETTVDGEDPTPVFPYSPNGPFWDAMGKIGKKRPLPSKYIMTKTHCGGRCVNCPASEYVTNATAFYAACERTSGIRGQQRFEFSSVKAEVAKVIHLIRNPFDNVIARFHLEQKHLVGNSPTLEIFFPKNATGFRRWCSELDNRLSFEDSKFLTSKQRHVMKHVPCRAEFYKYAQWHNLLIETVDLPTLVVFYEDFHCAQNATSQRIFAFLDQEATDPLRPFRSPPAYSDHFRPSEKDAAKILLETLSSTATWSLLQRYFDDRTTC